MDTEHTTPSQGRSHVTLVRVKDLLAHLDSERESDLPQPDRKSLRPYTAEPCLTVPDLVAWEAANGVVLPDAYRFFLLEIGNGGFMRGDYCDFEMFHLDSRRVSTRLRKPFPLSKDRFEQRMAQLQTEGRVDGPLFPELSVDDYWDGGDFPPGCLPVGRYPSYDSVFLVVSGNLHGMVWCQLHDGTPELDRQGKPFDFLDWFEDALMELSGYRSFLLNPLNGM